MSLGITLAVTGVEAVCDALLSLPGKVGSKYMKDAVAKGAKITEAALLAETPRGPTGNLQRSIGTKTVEYKSGTVVVVLGYQVASGGGASAGGTVQIGPNRAFHQYWIEFGTKPRKLKKSPVASNLKAFGGNDPGGYFASRGRAGWKDGIVIFRPRDGDIGAVEAQHPMQKAFERTGAQAREAITQELTAALDRAIAEVSANG